MRRLLRLGDQSTQLRRSAQVTTVRVSQTAAVLQAPTRARTMRWWSALVWSGLRSHAGLVSHGCCSGGGVTCRRVSHAPCVLLPDRLLATALVLTHHTASSPAFAGRSVAVVEANPPPSESPQQLAAKEGVDLRVFAIAPASQRVFQGAHAHSWWWCHTARPSCPWSLYACSFAEPSVPHHGGCLLCCDSRTRRVGRLG